jgi:PBP1b-binding outer membrane lipoprotein LpoB
MKKLLITVLFFVLLLTGCIPTETESKETGSNNTTIQKESTDAFFYLIENEMKLDNNNHSVQCF